MYHLRRLCSVCKDCVKRYKLVPNWDRTALACFCLSLNRLTIMKEILKRCIPLFCHCCTCVSVEQRLRVHSCNIYWGCPRNSDYCDCICVSSPTYLLLCMIGGVLTLIGSWHLFVTVLHIHEMLDVFSQIYNLNPTSSAIECAQRKYHCNPAWCQTSSEEVSRGWSLYQPGSSHPTH